MKSPSFEWDEEKDRINQKKHGLPLSDGAAVVANAIATVEDRRFDYNEDRFVAFGYVDRRLLACVFTTRDEVTRIISVRPASQRERIRYAP